MTMRSRRSILASAAAAIAAAAYPGGAGAVRPRQRTGPATHTVRITNFRFQPAVLAVSPGDMVIWINDDIAPHTATADDGRWDTGTIAGQERRKLVVTEDDRGAYFCRFHPQMRGHIESA